MFNSAKELLNKIRLGEDSFLEFKEVRFTNEHVSAPHRDALADELAAFANARGGICVLGIQDQAREILGLPLDRLDAVEDFVRELCTDSIHPPLSAIVIERLWLPTAAGDSVAVIKVEVPRSLFVHKSPSGYLYRVGSAKGEMTPDFLARLFQQRSQARIIRFDERPVPGATLDNLTPELWPRFTTSRSSDQRDDLLVKLAMAREDSDGVLHPTVAGVLMACYDPCCWFPNAYIQAVAYRGTEIRPSDDKLYQLDTANIVGPLDQQIMQACHFVTKNMRVAAIKTLGRRDIPQFDITAVFEAMVNAVAHRDYAIYGAKIRLRLFSNRLELYSPGTIPNTMTVASLPYRQAARNEAITSLLAKCPTPDANSGILTDRSTLMDKRGEDVQIILDNSERLSGKLPTYRLLDDAELLLTIYAAHSI